MVPLCVADTADTATVGGSSAGTVVPGSTSMTASSSITWAGVARVTDGAKQRPSPHLLPRNKWPGKPNLQHILVW